MSCATILCATTLAQENANHRIKDVIDRYAGDDTLAVAVVEIDGQWIAGVQQVLGTQLGDEGKRAANNPGFAVARGFVEGFRAAGAQEAVVMIGLHDLTVSTGPILILTTLDQEQARGVAELTRSLLQMGSSAAKDLRVAEHDENVLIGQQATIDRYQATTGGGREDLTTALHSLRVKAVAANAPSAGLIISLGPESRRVIRELWPQLPAPLAQLNGRLVADDIELTGMFAKCPPEWESVVEFYCRSEDSARTLKAMIGAAWRGLVAKLAENTKEPELAEVARHASQILSAEQNGRSVTIKASHDDTEIGDLFASVLLPAVNKARNSVARNRQMNQFKQMALAILNYESANGHLPASTAIVDKDGKPLLSWRVAVLPYVEQQALYNEFRLDEPWDSPHNLKLAMTVPGIYIDPANSHLAAEGKTTYQVPVHARSLFPPTNDQTDSERTRIKGGDSYRATGTMLRDVIDGTSNTAMIVQTAPEDAVVWTRPADWEVDLARAWEQLKGNSTDGSTVSAFCDGHVQAWDHDEENLDELLPKFITRDGKEVIEW